MLAFVSVNGNLAHADNEDIFPPANEILASNKVPSSASNAVRSPQSDGGCLSRAAPRREIFISTSVNPIAYVMFEEFERGRPISSTLGKFIERGASSPDWAPTRPSGRSLDLRFLP